ncbi:C-type lectin domain family 4 member M-like [Puntigrus tetrazona]|uniref:C-type lectin domain family 4 member M-like n=1 Tax=Puntigrus tetrazona TaxID=1606681 RepID=UPI001C8A724E|nr:C-type lectin domain family 4 member M-like [Puntigrus tetrazona]
MEQRTKIHQYENSAETFSKKKTELFGAIEHFLKTKDELVNATNQTTNQNNQLTKEISLLSKHLREMDGWRCFQSDLYYISSEEKNWYDGKEDCLKRGANLTIVNSNEEQDFLKTYDEVWIGLTNMENTWKWIDGSTPTSSFWAYGKPNGHTTKYCAVTSKRLDKSEWNDYPCSSSFKWVCERTFLK